jgi:Domain of unknown function (DUF397)
MTDRHPGTTALAHARWRKSSRSNNAAGCVELAGLASAIAVRDSKHADGPVLVFAEGSFRAFLTAAAGNPAA